MDKVSGEALAKHLGTRWQREEDTGLERLTKLGVTVTKVEGDLLAKMKEALAPIEKEWIEKAKAKGVDGVAALKMFNEEAAKQ